MEITFLRDRFTKMIRAMRFELGLFRVLAIMVGVTLPVYRILFPVEVFDPLAARLALSGILATFILGSYLIPWIRNNIRPLGHSFIHILTAWAGWLVYKNQFSELFLVNFLVVLLFAGSNFRRQAAWVYYAVVVLIAGAVACALPPGQVTLWHYFPILVLALIGTGAATAFMVMITKELDRHRNLVSSIYESSPDAILLVNAATLQVRAANQNAANMFAVGGLRTQAILYRELSEWFRQYQAGKQGADLTGRGISKIETLNGQALWVEVLITELSSDYRPEYLVAISDITQKQTLAERLQFSDDILSQVDHIVLVANANAEIVFVTPSVKQILGYAPQDVMGQGWWNIKRKNGENPSATIEYLKAYSRGEREPKEANYEVRHIDSAGKEQWILWKDTRTANGLVVGVGMPHTQAKRDATVKSVILNIAEASSKAKTPAEFYHYIHHEIRRLIDTPNFYIAVYDSERDEVSFPYYSDKEDDPTQSSGGPQAQSCQWPDRIRHQTEKTGFVAQGRHRRAHGAGRLERDRLHARGMARRAAHARRRGRGPHHDPRI